MLKLIIMATHQFRLYTLFLLFLNATLLLFCSCEKDKTYEQSEEQLIQINFTLDKFNSNAIEKEQLEISWQNLTTVQSETHRVFEYPVHYKNEEKQVIEGYQDEFWYSLVAYITEEGKYNYYLIQLLATSEYSGEPTNYINLEKDKYKGMVYLYDLEGTIITEEFYNNGILVSHRKLDSKYTPFIKRNFARQCKLAPLDPNLCDDGGTGGCGFKTVTTQTWRFDYDVTYNSLGTPLNVQYVGRTLIKTNTQRFKDCNGGGNRIVRANNARSSPERIDVDYIPSPEPDGINTVVAPDCKSFKYKKVAGNWQASATKGIKFNVVVIENKKGKWFDVDFGNEIFTFERSIQPTLGGKVTPGKAAIATSAVLDNTIRQTINHFKNLPGTSLMQIEFWFKERLKKNYKQQTFGSMSVGNKYNLSVTQYKSNFFDRDYGDCDER